MSLLKRLKKYLYQRYEEHYYLICDIRNWFLDHSKSIKDKHGHWVIALLMGYFLAASWDVYFETPFTQQLLRSHHTRRDKRPFPKKIKLVAISDLSYQALGLPTHLGFPRQCFARALERIHASKPALVIIDGYFQDEPYDCPRNLNPKAKASCLSPSSLRPDKEAMSMAIASGPTALASHKVNHLLQETSSDPSMIALESGKDFKEAALFNVPMVLFKVGDTISQLSTNNKIPFIKPLTFAKMLSTSPEEHELPQNSSLINFYGPPAATNPIHIHQILNAENDQTYDFSGDIVFIGTMSEFENRAFGSKERFATTGDEPGNTYFGAEIHATIAGNLIDKSWIRKLPHNTAYLLIWAISSMVFLFQMKFTPWQSIALFILAGSVWMLLSYYAFASHHLLIPGPIVFLKLGSLIYIIHLTVISGGFWRRLQKVKATLMMGDL